MKEKTSAHYLSWDGGSTWTLVAVTRKKRKRVEDVLWSIFWPKKDPSQSAGTSPK